MATLDSIADEIGYSRNELMQSMVKFGLTNRDWRNEGLTAHKRLPRYEENPMATKPPSPAQLAARARFAEMARSGSLNRKRQIAAKRKTNPASKVPEIILQQLGGNKFVAMTGASEFIAGSEFLGFKIPKNSSPANRVTIKYSPARDLYTIDFIKTSRNGLDTKIVQSYKDVSADQLREIFTGFTGMETSLGTLGRRTNPAKKTVSQKISQLVHEGYPQKQAVAIALNEERSGKVKRNPARAKSKSSTVYRVEYSKDCKNWDTWMTVMYLDMAKAIAQRLADDPFHKNHYVRIESATEIL